MPKEKNEIKYKHNFTANEKKRCFFMLEELSEVEICTKEQKERDDLLRYIMFEILGIFNKYNLTESEGILISKSLLNIAKGEEDEISRMD